MSIIKCFWEQQKSSLNQKSSLYQTSFSLLLHFGKVKFLLKSKKFLKPNFLKSKIYCIIIHYYLLVQSIGCTIFSSKRYQGKISVHFFLKKQWICREHPFNFYRPFLFQSLAIAWPSGPQCDDVWEFRRWFCVGICPKIVNIALGNTS